MIEDSSQVDENFCAEDQTSEVKPYPLIINYCPNCSLPFEYCEYSQKSSTCKQQLESNGPQNAPTETDDYGTPSPQNASSTAKNNEKGPNAIKIASVQRSKKKFITRISGLSSFGLKISEVSKILSKKFACSAAVSQENDTISLQGDVSRDLIEFLLEKYPVRKHRISAPISVPYPVAVHPLGKHKKKLYQAFLKSSVCTKFPIPNLQLAIKVNIFRIFQLS